MSQDGRLKITEMPLLSQLVDDGLAVMNLQAVPLAN